jgi:hypothetical protein
VGKAIFYFYLFTIGLSFIISNINAISTLRKRFSPWTGEAENEWGYGQVLALALVLMPGLEFVAACYRGCSFCMLVGRAANCELHGVVEVLENKTMRGTNIMHRPRQEEMEMVSQGVQRAA